ncbi:uncharacterized protein J8A68_005960 [[Candida] subhashii]|uniref:Uncharacterized protein n=1 Tax=[Candida] subhashii TaxID=561895 RepID=A0A8J5UIW2_9ASCO|nr:uncharacterized protein J8A68_005960 [[Candida] subhashii]KAG7660541.1 hypothetical protein J8A68_005960 [[Candida] subhashii]
MYMLNLSNEQEANSLGHKSKNKGYPKVAYVIWKNFCSGIANEDVLEGAALYDRLDEVFSDENLMDDISGIQNQESDVELIPSIYMQDIEPAPISFQEISEEDEQFEIVPEIEDNMVELNTSNNSLLRELMAKYPEVANERIISLQNLHPELHFPSPVDDEAAENIQFTEDNDMNPVVADVDIPPVILSNDPPPLHIYEEAPTYK